MFAIMFNINGAFETILVQNQSEKKAKINYFLLHRGACAYIVQNTVTGQIVEKWIKQIAPVRVRTPAEMLLEAVRETFYGEE